MQNLIQGVHPEWREYLALALTAMDKSYLQGLVSDENWLPGLPALFRAFSLPLSSTGYILLGESPYPRPQSANGYAFWDDAVSSLWSSTGFSKEVNRATSLRNFLKMLLLARGDLSHDCSQQAIARLDKSAYYATAEAFFRGMMSKGILLLNASLVYRDGQVPYHAKQWRPFIYQLFRQLADDKAPLKLILLGKIAEQVPETKLSIGLVAEHPYNISFITNPKVLQFFKPMDLLSHHENKNHH